MAEPIHYFNGKFVPKHQILFSIDDVGILRGYGIFDFFKAIGSVPLFIEDHLQRLANSADKMNLPLPLSIEEIESIVQELINRNNFEYSSIKIVVTGGETTDGFSPGKPNIVILNSPFSNAPSEYYEKGISLMLDEYHRDFPEVKHTYYARAVSLQKAWASAGHLDVIYHDGTYISEVSRSNVFFFKGDKLKTNSDGVLNGVTRRNVLKCASELFEVEVGRIRLDELLGADEAFITSTVKRVMPLVKLDDQMICDGHVGPETRQLMKSFDLYIDEYVERKKSAQASLSS